MVSSFSNAFRFYSNVMSAPLNSKDDVLHQLQKTFAFMNLSKRKSYSPGEMIWTVCSVEFFCCSHDCNLIEVY